MGEECEPNRIDKGMPYWEANGSAVDFLAKKENCLMGCIMFPFKGQAGIGGRVNFYVDGATEEKRLDCVRSWDGQTMEMQKVRGRC